MKARHFLLALFIAISACARQPIQETPETRHSALAPTQPAPTNTASPSATTPSPSPMHTESATPPAPTPTDPSPTEIPAPESFYIENISGHMQTYPLSCEASAAVDWAGFFGMHIYEYNFQNAMPLSDNPETGYVGNVLTDAWGQVPPAAYGVHAPPVATLLREYGLPAEAVRDYSLDEVKLKLSEGKPIIAWVIGNMVSSVPIVYVARDGSEVLVAPQEHVVILTGYNAESVRYMNNGRFYDVPNEIFLRSWGVLGNMAIIQP